MSDFIIYFKTGWQHIMSPQALDHLLFIAVLTSAYLIEDYKKLLWLVTAFTAGHCITLLLSVVDVIRFNSQWVEFFIPLTIVVTAAYNFFNRRTAGNKIWWNYLLAFSFGLVHGMGFANTIRFMLAKAQSILFPLLSFNLGLEAGQLMLVLILLLICRLLKRYLNLAPQYWMYVVSAIAFVAGCGMCLSRWPF